MKKLLKILLYLVIIFISLILVLTVVAKLSENKIADIALEQVSESIDAPIEIENVSFNLLRGFPFATIELNGITLGNPATLIGLDSNIFAGSELVNINKIYLSVKSQPLLDSKVEIVKIEIDGAELNYMVGASGATNYDFLMDTTLTDTVETVVDTAATPLHLTLKELSLKNIKCNYIDSTIQVKAKVFIPELFVKANIRGEAYSGNVKGSMILSDCSFEETNLNLMQLTTISFDLAYEKDSANIRDLTIITDGAKLNLKGSALVGDDIVTDLDIKGSDINIAELLKYAPKELLKEAGLKSATGIINFNTKVKGLVSETEVPHVELNIGMTGGNIVTYEYPALKNISFNGDITNGILRNNKTTQIDFSSLRFETAKSKFNFSFSVLDLDNIKYKLKTNMNINVAEFSSFIPDSTVQYVDGNISASLSTSGQLPDSINDDFTDYVLARTRLNVKLSNFNIDVDSSLSIKGLSAQMAYKPNNFKLSNFNVSVPAYKVNLNNTSMDVGFTGSIQNTAAMNIDLRSYHIELDSSVISGSAKIQNLDNPTYDFNSNIKLNLAEIKTMMPDSLLNKLSGEVTLAIKSAATISNIDSIDSQMNEILFENSSFNIGINNLNVEMFDDTVTTVENFSGIINMDTDTITINKMSGVVAGFEFAIDSTEIWNVYKTIIQERKDKELVVQTNIILGGISNELLAPFMVADTTNTGTTLVNTEQSEVLATNETGASTVTNNEADASEPAPLLPNFKELGLPHFTIRGKLAVSKIEYEKNVLDNISLNFRFSDSLYVIDEFKLSMCGGDINTSVLFDARNWDKPKVDVKNTITGMDLNELLLVNDNFDQTDMTHENLSGILTSELHARAFYENGDWPTERVRVKGHFTLDEGKIHDFQPLVDASVGIGGLKELDKMDFSTLKTSIFMFKDKIYVPKTDVVSNALDLSAFAMHGMTDEQGYEYHLVLHLGDLLTGKSDELMKKQKKQSKKDGGTVERKGINLIAMEIGEEKKNGFDNAKLKAKFKKSLKRQQAFLNLLFDPRLVNFSTEMDRSLFVKSQKKTH